MLDAFAVIKLKVLFHLRFLFTFGWFVYREFDETIAIAHHLAHQGGVFGRDIFVTVAMFIDMISYGVVRPDWRRQNKGKFVLSKDITCSIFHSRFRPGISKALKAKNGFVKMRGLLGVSYVKLDVIGSLKREEI